MKNKERINLKEESKDWENKLEEKLIKQCKDLCKTILKLRKIKKGLLYKVPYRETFFNAKISDVCDIRIDLDLKKSSWVNFFRVYYNRKNSIKLVNDASLGNFHACIIELERQFREKTDFKESFYMNINKKCLEEMLK